jgi:hypothetical protein
MGILKKTEELAKKTGKKAKDVGGKAVDVGEDVGKKGWGKTKEVGGDKGEDVGKKGWGKTKEVGGKALDKAKGAGKPNEPEEEE